MPRPTARDTPSGAADTPSWSADHEGRHRRGRPGLGATGDDPVVDHPQGPPSPGTGEDDDPSRVRLLTVPTSLQAVDLSVGTRAVRGLLVVALVVLVVLAGRWWWAEQGSQGVPVETLHGEATAVPDPTSGSDQGGPGPLPGAAPSVTTSAPGTTGQSPQPSGPTPGVVVHVIGEVERPGVVELPTGARVADAIAASGGFTPDADPALLNLARTLLDGEQVWVGAPGEEPPPGFLVGQGTGPGTPTGQGRQGATPAGAPPALLDLNAATQADLEELPGIGPVTAERILAFRDQHGRFTAIEELMEVSGIGERTFAQLEPLVTVLGGG